MTRSKPLFNWKAISLAIGAMLLFALGVGLNIYAQYGGGIHYALLSALALGAGVYLGLVGALWWSDKEVDHPKGHKKTLAEVAKPPRLNWPIS
jgi:hypothetical protein